MTETPTLHEYIGRAIYQYLADTGGGIPNGFIYAVNYVDSDGATNNDIGCMEDQSPVLSSGLLAYLQAVCDAWVGDALFGGCDCENEDCD